MWRFINFFTAVLVLALPATATATEKYNDFGSSLFSGIGHPAFADPVAVNIADTTDIDAAAFSAIEPAAGGEAAGDRDFWAQELPESLVEIEAAPVSPEDAGDKPPVF